MSAIHDAVRNGDLGKVKSLLKDNTDLVFTKDGKGLTPLYLAASKGESAVAEVLLAHRAEVNPTDRYGDTPLHAAACNGHRHVVELLLAHEAEVNATLTDGWTPLHFAASKGHHAVVELLLAHHAQVNATDNDGWTPLHCAAEGQPTVVELLLAHQAEINATNNKGHTPLHFAVLRGQPAVAELLLAHHAEVNATDNDGRTPLDLAPHKDHQVVELLLAHQAKGHQGTGWTLAADRNGDLDATRWGAGSSLKRICEIAGIYLALEATFRIGFGGWPRFPGTLGQFVVAIFGAMAGGVIGRAFGEVLQERLFSMRKRR